MAKVLIALLLLVLTTEQAVAQQQSEAERIAARRIAFFTRHIELTESEAIRFWPAYNEYENQRNMIQQERFRLLRELRQNERNLSDDELKEGADRLIGFRLREAELSGELHERLASILPPLKVVRFYQAENMFRNQLLNELRDGRRGTPPPSAGARINLKR